MSVVMRELVDSVICQRIALFHIRYLPNEMSAGIISVSALFAMETLNRELTPS
jgi:hypothetical protein